MPRPRRITSWPITSSRTRISSSRSTDPGGQLVQGAEVRRGGTGPPAVLRRGPGPGERHLLGPDPPQAGQDGRGPGHLSGKLMPRRRPGALAQNIAIILNGQVKTDPSKTSEAINANIEAGLLNPAQQKNFLGQAQNLFVGQDKELASSYAKIEEHNKAIEEFTKTLQRQDRGQERGRSVRGRQAAPEDARRPTSRPRSRPSPRSRPARRASSTSSTRSSPRSRPGSASKAIPATARDTRRPAPPRAGGEGSPIEEEGRRVLLSRRTEGPRPGRGAAPEDPLPRAQVLRRQRSPDLRPGVRPSRPRAPRPRGPLPRPGDARVPDAAGRREARRGLPHRRPPDPDDEHRQRLRRGRDPRVRRPRPQAPPRPSPSPTRPSSRSTAWASPSSIGTASSPGRSPAATASAATTSAATSRPSGPCRSSSRPGARSRSAARSTSPSRPSARSTGSARRPARPSSPTRATPRPAPSGSSIPRWWPPAASASSCTISSSTGRRSRASGAR